jgi:hypothetical protein
MKDFQPQGGSRFVMEFLVLISIERIDKRLESRGAANEPFSTASRGSSIAAVDDRNCMLSLFVWR